MVDYKVSISRNIFEPGSMSIIQLSTVLDRIKLGNSKATVERIRSSDNKIERDELKKTLPCVCFSGQFTERKESALIRHSGLICLDFDHCDVIAKKMELAGSPYVLAVWISPSGSGVKALVKVPPGKDLHRDFFAGLSNLFQGIDQSGKDIGRACFESYDPEIYINPEAIIFDTPAKASPVINGMARNGINAWDSERITDPDEIVDRIEVWLHKTDSFIPGNRHNYILRFAGATNRYGISESIALRFFAQYAEEGFTVREIESIVRSAYLDRTRHATEYFEKSHIAGEAITIPALVNPVEKDNKPLEDNPFPLDVFPGKVATIVEATRQHLSYPIDFSGASILFAISASIGNTHNVRIKRGFKETAVVYLALVGPPGTNKSHPLSFFTEPINEYDRKSYRVYLAEKTEYNRISKMKKDEQRLQGVDDLPPPVWNKILLSDATMEKIAEVHRYNPRGLGVLNDELANWFMNFNRYNKGNDQPFWLSNWSSKTLRIERKSSEEIFIYSPFISVAGSIQTELLGELFKDNRGSNGFVDRVLFAFPANLKKPYWTDTEIDQEHIDDWFGIVNRLLGISLKHTDDNSFAPVILDYCSEAKKILLEWQRSNTDQVNDSEAGIASVFSKMDLYVNRFALILELLKFACNDSWKDCISIDSIRGAIKLVEYFKTAAVQVRNTLKQDEAFQTLTMDKQRLFESLPDQFRTNEGIELAKQLGVPSRTFQYFIENRNLFTRPERGVYQKRKICS